MAQMLSTVVGRQITSYRHRVYSHDEAAEDKALDKCDADAAHGPT